MWAFSNIICTESLLCKKLVQENIKIVQLLVELLKCSDIGVLGEAFYAVGTLLLTSEKEDLLSIFNCSTELLYVFFSGMQRNRNR